MYKVDLQNKQLQPLDEISYASLGLKERFDIQEWIEKTPDILGEELLIIAKEYELPSRCRLDLLAIDKNAQLVIIELKRDDSGAGVEWQAIKYASYCAVFTNEELFRIFAAYLQVSEEEAQQRIEHFVDTEDALESLNQKQRIILASRKYHSDVVSAILWLLDYGLDIQCVKIDPYLDPDTHTLFIYPSTIIPAPEARDYIKRRETKSKAKSLGQNSSFSLEVSDLPLPELRRALSESLAREGVVVASVRVFLQLLLSAPRTFEREEIKAYLVAQGVSENLTLAGTALSNISTFLTRKGNAHMRQLVTFEGGTESGAKKNHYALRDEYREMVIEVLGVIE